MSEAVSENVLPTAQQLIQDVIAPDVRELKVRMGVLENQIESLEKHIDFPFQAMDQKTDLQFNAIIAAISESKAQTEFSPLRLFSSLSERVAVLEAQRS